MFTVWEEGVILTEEERFSEIPPGIANNEVLRGVWSELVGMMPKEVLDNLDEMDGLFIEAMCRHYAIARKASNEVISADSVLVTDNPNHRMQKHPAEVIFRSQSQAFLAYMKEAGWTPKARNSGKNKDTDNPFLM